MIYKCILEKIRNDYYFVKKEMYKQLFKYNQFRISWIRLLGKDIIIKNCVKKFFGRVDFFSSENKFLSMWHAFTYMKFKYPDEKDESNIEMLAKQVYNSHKFYMKYMNKK